MTGIEELLKKSGTVMFGGYAAIRDASGLMDDGTNRCSGGASGDESRSRSGGRTRGRSAKPAPVGPRPFRKDAMI